MPSTTKTKKPAADEQSAGTGEKLLSLDELLQKLDPGTAPQKSRKPAGTFRRGRFSRMAAPSQSSVVETPTDNSAEVQLVERNGVLRWEMAAQEAPQTEGARFRAGPRRSVIPVSGGVVRSAEFERIPSSQAAAALVALDKKLTPDADYGAAYGRSGLRMWDKGALKWVACGNDCKLRDAKVLLLIHGTFSKSEAFTPTEDMKKILSDALAPGKYDHVLAFDHPTLSVSPMLNAYDLAARLRDLSGDGAAKNIDIVCHSRGGLVTRWFCELMAPETTKRRAILVACPLGGTSLAAPHRIREVFNLLTNVARVGSVATGFFGGPFLLAAQTIMTLTAKLTGALSGPLTDAIVSLIPGLDGQSRTGNNQELMRLHANTGGAVFNDGPGGVVRYWSIVSNFEPQTSGGVWGFLSRFSRPLMTLADMSTDFVFDGANDLVVDTASMTEASRGLNGVEVAHNFGTQGKVHHTNYFEQPETVKTIRGLFGIP